MKTKVIIDRFEGNYAVIELPDRSMVSIPRFLVPNGAEGDVICIEHDADETAKRKKKIDELMKSVWEDE